MSGVQIPDNVRTQLETSQRRYSRENSSEDIQASLKAADHRRQVCHQRFMIGLFDLTSQNIDRNYWTPRGSRLRLKSLTPKKFRSSKLNYRSRPPRNWRRKCVRLNPAARSILISGIFGLSDLLSIYPSMYILIPICLCVYVLCLSILTQFASVYL